MFRCQLCDVVVPPRTPCQRIVLEQRKKKYPYRATANQFYRREPPKKKRKEVYRDDPGGVGTEIVREVIACPACAIRKSI